jgi:tripartite-type tricarboxylate transporter receptor subunit TctC
MKRVMRVGFLVCTLLLSLFTFQIVQAADFPTKPITLVVPVKPGGSHDLTGRAVTSVATEVFGQPVVSLYKPGAGGGLGTEYVANAAPDGYTLLLGGPGWNSTLPAVEGRSKGPEDLDPVCLINYSSAIVTVNANAPFKTLKEMIAWGKQNPGQLVVGSTGTWGNVDLAWKMIAQETGITARVVPYDGGAPVTLALLGNQVHVTFMTMTSIMPHVQAGKLRILAVLADKRVKALPDIPTAKEEGLNVTNLLWRGVIAPKNTPRPIIEKLAAGFKKMTEYPSVLKTINGLGDEINYMGPDEFRKFWESEYKIHQEIGKLYKK